MISVHAGAYIVGIDASSYQIPFDLTVQCERYLFTLPILKIPIYLKRIKKVYNNYNWKTIRKMHNTDGYNVVVELRNPESIIETKEISFDDFNDRLVKKNLYNDWHISGVYVYSNDQGFVGSIEDSLRLYNKNIVPYKSSTTNPYCQIGFSKKEKMWYGWHRSGFDNMRSFSIGTTTNFGDDIFVPSNSADLIQHIIMMFKSYDRIEASVGVVPTKNVAVRAFKEKHSPDCVQKTFFYPKNWGRGSWTASSLENAREMAVEYAERSPYVL